MLTKGDKCIIIIRYYNFAMIKTEADQPLYREPWTVRARQAEFVLLPFEHSGENSVARTVAPLSALSGGYSPIEVVPRKLSFRLREPIGFVKAGLFYF